MKTICKSTGETVHSGASADSAVYCHCSAGECRMKPTPAAARSPFSPQCDSGGELWDADEAS